MWKNKQEKRIDGKITAVRVMGQNMGRWFSAPNRRQTIDVWCHPPKAIDSAQHRCKRVCSHGGVCEGKLSSVSEKRTVLDENKAASCMSPTPFYTPVVSATMSALSISHAWLFLYSSLVKLDYKTHP